MKYAHVERERRYLPLSGIEGPAPIRILNIQDRYIGNSTLRLRRVEEEGKLPVFKLGQKKRIGVESPLRIAHTTMYITKPEFDFLAALPTKPMEKQRSIFDFGDWQFALDEFKGELAGLLLVEVDLGPYGAAHPALPFEELIEVTGDERFNGGNLASTTRADLQLVLEEYGAK